jgi:hypothetical protein
MNYVKWRRGLLFGYTHVHTDIQDGWPALVTMKYRGQRRVFYEEDSSNFNNNAGVHRMFQQDQGRTVL